MRPPPPPPPEPAGAHARPRRLLALLVLVLVLGTFARLARTGEGLPYLHHWDEPATAGRSLQMLKTGDLDPGWYRYGSLTIYLNASVDVAHYLWLAGRPEEALERIGSPDELRTEADSGWKWTISHPSFYRSNRALTALLGSASILLSFLLGRRLAGDWAGLGAAALLAGLPFHAEHSALVTTDVPAAFFSLACVLAAVVWVQGARSGALVLSLALGGLAAAVKYNAALALAAPLAALVLRAPRRAGGASPWLWLAALGIPPLAFLAAMPYALIELPAFLRDAGHEVHHYKVAGHGEHTVAAGLPHLAHQLGELARENGPPVLRWVGLAVVLALALDGAARLLARRAGLVALAFPLAYGWFMCSTVVGFHRNFLALYPFLAVLAASGLARGVAELQRRGRPRIAAGVARAAAAALVAMLLVVAGSAWREGTRAETRTRGVLALDALAREHGWRRAGVARELRVHPSDLRRLAVPFEELPLLELRARAGDFDAVLSAGAWSVRKPGREALVERLDAAVPRGRVHFEATGAPLDLGVRTANPSVVVGSWD